MERLAVVATARKRPNTYRVTPIGYRASDSTWPVKHKPRLIVAGSSYEAIVDWYTTATPNLDTDRLVFGWSPAGTVAVYVQDHLTFQSMR